MTSMQSCADTARTTLFELNDALRGGPEFVLWLAQSGPDADALRGEGASVGWWGEFYLRHATLLYGFEGTAVVGVTLDDAGAWEARRTRRLLAGVLSPHQVELHAPAVELGAGATLADHLAAGYSLAETRRVYLRDMRSVIRREEDRRVQSPPLVFERRPPFARTAAP